MKTFRYVDGLPTLKSLATKEINGKRYYITPKGKKLPSVTTVLGHFQSKHLTEWRNRVGEEQAAKISSAAARRGTAFHNLMENYLKNQNDMFANIMPDTKKAFQDIRVMVDKIDNIHYIESPMYSERLGIAGKPDVIAEYEGRLSVIDFKTSSRAKQEDHIQNYFEQTTAYAEMYQEMIGKEIDQVVILISVDHDNPQFFVRNKSKYVPTLLQKIDEYKREFHK